MDLAGGSSADVDTFEEEFLRSLPTHVDGNDSGILDDDGLTDTTNKTHTLTRRLFNDGIDETPPNVRVAVTEAAASLTNLASFSKQLWYLRKRVHKSRLRTER